MTDRLRMLMVEDDNVDRMAFERFVEREGLPYDYRMATSAADARAILSADRFDIVLTDYQLGDGTAFDLIDAVGETPALIITGTGDEKIAVEAMKHGFYDYLVKEPTGSYLSALPVVVKQTLDHSGAKRKLVEYQGRLEEMVAERTRELVETARELREEIGRRQCAEKALRESETKYRTLVENAGEAIFIAQEGKIKFVNPKTEELSGQNRQELLSTGFEAFIHPDDRAIVRERHIQRQQGINVPSNYSFRIIHKSSEVKWVELNVVMVDWEGKAATLNFLRDITERRRGEAEREVLQDQLLQAQKLEAVGRLAGGVAHDFNNLLTVILGYGEMALQDLHSDHPHYALLKDICQAGSRARNLTRQLLAFSRKQSLHMETLDINDLVKGFEKLMRRVIGEDVVLKLSLHGEPILVKGDLTHLEQVLMNLAVNARDAMSEGGALTIETDMVALDQDYAKRKPGVSPGRYAMIAVTDTGVGMDMETMRHIFEPFFTTKDRDRGTGLGLATSYGIVKQHNGDIWVYSEPGHGTTFKIYLPQVAEEAIVEGRTVESSQPVAGTGTVLVVEDDPPVLKLAGDILRASGYHVLQAGTPVMALELAKCNTKPIDLLLSDVILPGMRGPELFRRIKESHPETRVVYMSGYSESVMEERGLLEDKGLFIAKPFTGETLRKRLAETLGQ